MLAMADVAVGLGANLGKTLGNMRQAVERLRNVIEIRAISSLYRTEPVGLRDQPVFLNAVLAGQTQLDPHGLIKAFGEIEDDMGRRRDVPMGPRTLDLDLLLYDDRVIAEAGLAVPHPRMAQRRFVLEPLAEVAPDMVHPVLGRTVAKLLADLPVAEMVERVVEEDWPPA